MSADSNASEEDLRFELKIAARWGRYAQSGTPEAIRRLTDAGRFREAFELAETEAGPWPREDMFWFSMRDIAAGLGLHERVAHWARRMEDAEAAEEAYADALFKQIEALVRSEHTVQDGMFRIIDLCSRARPNPDWERFKALDFEADVGRLRDWLEAALSDEPPPDDVDGLWFGLFNPIRGEEATADMYASGGVEDPEDRERGFPYELTWTPEAADATSEALDAIYKIAYRGGIDDEGWTEGLGNDAEHPLCLSYGCLAVRWLVTSLPSDLLVGAAEERAIEVGYDSGDLLRIGTVDRHGLIFPTDGLGGPR